VLRILRGEGKPLPILEIAHRTLTVVPGITGLIDRLEHAGLVRRERCSEDRRVIFVAISHEALKLLSRLDDPVRDLHGRLLSRVGYKELKTLIRLLEKVRESASGQEV
jgi:DNA-binding MarR family transcriptional regulator